MSEVFRESTIPTRSKESLSNKPISNPREFFSLWRQSPEYLESIETFWQKRKIPAKITAEEKTEIFEEYYVDIKTLFYNFGQRMGEKEKRPLVYDPAEYSAETNELIKNYFVVVRDFAQEGQKDLKEADETRRRVHNQVAKQIIKEEPSITGNINLARELVHLMSIGEHLEDYNEPLSFQQTANVIANS
jgi:hypothetical protein